MLSERGEEEMRQAQFRHAIMVAPAPGFTDRVMTRIQARERARARRWGVLGAGLLFLAAGIVSVLLGGVLLGLLAIAATNPDVVLTVFVSLTPLVDFGTTLAEALWIALTVVASNVSAVQLLAFAASVFVLTLVWVRVVSGSSLHLLTQTVGGFGK